LLINGFIFLAGTVGLTGILEQFFSPKPYTVVPVNHQQIINGSVSLGASSDLVFNMNFPALESHSRPALLWNDFDWTGKFLLDVLFDLEASDDAFSISP